MVGRLVRLDRSCALGGETRSMVGSVNTDPPQSGTGIMMSPHVSADFRVVTMPSDSRLPTLRRVAIRDGGFRVARLVHAHDGGSEPNVRSFGHQGRSGKQQCGRGQLPPQTISANSRTESASNLLKTNWAQHPQRRPPGAYYSLAGALALPHRTKFRKIQGMMGLGDKRARIRSRNPTK